MLCWAESHSQRCLYLRTSDHAPSGHLTRAKALSALASSSVELGKSLPGDASSLGKPADPHGLAWEKPGGSKRLVLGHPWLGSGAKSID